MSGATLVTGANGFIGRALTAHLAARGERVTGATRATVGAIDGTTDWSAALQGASAVVHLAARAHVTRETAGDPAAEFRRVNVEGTLALARQAADAGVRRFLFLSSIGVNGDRNGRPFTEADPPAPAEPYARSKREAEEGLRALVAGTATALIIVRPPLVYGPNAPGNFGRLATLVAKGAPLPLAGIDNRRTLVGIDNLVDLIAVALDHPAAAGELFLAGDAEALSTPDLLRAIGEAIGRPARLFAVPAPLLRIVAAAAGRSGELERLCGSLTVDIGKAERLLGWRPPIAVKEGLRRACEALPA